MKFLFYKPLKVEHDPNNILFWSDTHFGHRCESWELPLWKARGFSSFEEHDEALIQRWNERANQQTIFFHLGDFIFGYDSIQRMKDILNRVFFDTLYIMPGNHCSGWKQHFEQQHSNIWHINNKKVIFLPNYVETYINKQPIVLSHFPIVSFNGQGKGSWMLHGHCHGNLKRNPIGEFLYKAKILEVCIETSPFPSTFKSVESHMLEKENVTFDHHNQLVKNPF